MKSSQNYVIILGGGKGLRMGATVPKQFLEVGGLPILMRTILRFREYASWSESELRVILVLPHDQQDFWRELCQKHHFEADYEMADGGETRFHSIRNGLALIPDDAQGVVAVHDGVRPFPAKEVIARCFDTARTTGSAVPVIPVVETVRRLLPAASSAAPSAAPSAAAFSAAPSAAPTSAAPSSMAAAVGCSAALPQKSVTVPRSEYRLVQTPQAFDIQLHKRAYRQPYSDAFTDDASVVEAYWQGQGAEGKEQEITLVEGNRENIKITTPFDLVVAEALVASCGAHESNKPCVS